MRVDVTNYPAILKMNIIFTPLKNNPTKGKISYLIHQSYPVQGYSGLVFTGGVMLSDYTNVNSVRFFTKNNTNFLPNTKVIIKRVR